MKNRNVIAWSLLLLLALIWGSSPFLIKKALIKLDPFEIGALRLTLASFVLFPFLARNLKEIKRKDYLVLFISGIVGNVLPYFLYPIAQTKIDSATSGVLTSLTPFFALIVGVIFYQLKATKNNIIGLVVGFVGTSIGTIFGISLTYYVQEFGIDYSEAVNQISSSNMVVPNVFYAKVTPEPVSYTHLTLPTNREV